MNPDQHADTVADLQAEADARWLKVLEAEAERARAYVEWRLAHSLLMRAIVGARFDGEAGS